MASFRKFFRQTRNELAELAGSKLGSVLTGRAIVERRIQKSELKNAKLIDFFGSPATAGTKQQTTARTAAIIYGAYMGGTSTLAKSWYSSWFGTGASGSAAGGAAGAGSSGFLSATGKTLTTGLLLRALGIGSPGMGPQYLPQDNFLPYGLPGAMYDAPYGDYPLLGGSLPFDDPTMKGEIYEQGGINPLWYILGAVGLVGALMFIAFRR